MGLYWVGYALGTIAGIYAGVLLERWLVRRREIREMVDLSEATAMALRGEFIDAKDTR